MPEKFSEEFLRSKGYEKRPDGSWGKACAEVAHTPSRPDRERVPERPLAASPHVEKPPIRRLLVLVTVRTVKPRDYDGLGPASKGYVDCLKHVGLVEDDSPERLEVVFDTEKVQHYEEEETVMEVWELPPERQ